MEVKEYYIIWEEIYGFVLEEVEVFKVLVVFVFDDVLIDFIVEYKCKVVVEYDWFVMQFEMVEQVIEGYCYVQCICVKVGFICDILVWMEVIIGLECYNVNIQNYSVWGVWEGEGWLF